MLLCFVAPGQKEGTLLRLFVQCGTKGGERGLIAESMAKHNLALECASLKLLRCTLCLEVVGTGTIVSKKLDKTRQDIQNNLYIK